jgi:hypothetical protein
MIQQILNSKITAGLALFLGLLGFQWLMPKVQMFNEPLLEMGVAGTAMVAMCLLVVKLFN